MAYTFDAGPNAVLFLQEVDLNPFACLFYSVFGSVPFEEFFRGKLPNPSMEFSNVPESLMLDSNLQGQVQYTIVSRVGQGPKNVDPTG